MIKNFILTTWIITFAMLVNIVYIEHELQPLKPYAPDTAGFMISSTFMMTSFIIFAVGMFTMLAN
jgi:hypothetical protein